MHKERAAIALLSAQQQVWHAQFPELTNRAHQAILGYLCTRGRGGVPGRQICGAIKERLLLDDATSALDEKMEERAYGLLREELPDTTTISIAHRASAVLEPMRRWTLAPEAGTCRLHAD